MSDEIINNRIADAAIYDNLDFFDTPKDYFRLVLDEIAARQGEPASLLDVGCANGAFLHHAHARFPGCQLSGLEPVETLAANAARNVASADVYCGTLTDETKTQPAGVVTLLGVMGIFSEPDSVLQRLLAHTTENGAAYIFSPFNEEPVDVVLNYRRAPDGEWESGHNLFSMATMEACATDAGVRASWVNFSMSQQIVKSDDPMRSWTEPFRGNPHHLFYGTNMFSTMKLLVLEK